MLFLRGLRWRRGFSAAVLLVGMISAAVAAIGPLYARASSESTLTDELRPPGRAGRPGLHRHPPPADPTRPARHCEPIGPERASRVRPADRGESTVVTALEAAAQFTTPSTMVWRTARARHS